MRRLLLVTLATAAAACGDDRNPLDPASAEPAVATLATGPAPLVRGGPRGDRIPDRYIVVLKADGDLAQADELVRVHGGTIHRRYSTALRGFAATIPEAALEGIRRNPHVAYVEQDAHVRLAGVQPSPPSWGLDRIDQRARSSTSSADWSYTYDNDGAGVRAYILDTGIRATHREFGGRVVQGWDFVDNDGDAADCHGHGTHVAGTVGGTATGVAKQVSLVAVRVLDCAGSGTYSGVIAGVDWVAANAVRPAVANMSIGGDYSTALNDAVNGATASGVLYVVAAGNNGVDACAFSPSSAIQALAVGATAVSDERANYSNFGTCVDLFAPGSAIYSAVHIGDDAYASYSGTSMAAPHVTGVAAMYLAAHPTASPAELEGALEAGATQGAVTKLPAGTPNLLLYSLIAGAGSPPPAEPEPTPTPEPAVASVTVTLAAGSIEVGATTQATAVARDAAGQVIAGKSAAWRIADGGGAAAVSASGVVSGLAAGTATVAATIDGVSGGAPVSVSEPRTEQPVPPPPSDDVLYVHSADLDGGAAGLGRGYWQARVTFTIHDGSHGAVAGVAVSGDWSGALNGSGSCVTDASGTCTIESAPIPNARKSAEFSLAGLAASRIVYATSLNHDPDGDCLPGQPGAAISIRKR